MQNNSTFTPATSYYTTLSVQRKQSCLNKPGRAGLSLNGKVQYGVAASLSGITFLFKLRHHAHRNPYPVREVRSRATSASKKPCENQQDHRGRTPNYPGQIATACRRNGSAVTAVAPRFNTVEAGNFQEGFQQIIHCNSVF